MPLPKRLNELWELAEAIAREQGGDPRYVLDPCGLLLERPPVPWDYHCSPRNVLTFASTGGDGVHFGILQLAERVPDGLPVVMTVPMSDARNIVVAESLGEFLGLGYHVGWFSLEQLAYDPGWAVHYFAQPQEEWPECEALLQRMRSHLPLSYAPLSLERIADLQGRYSALLEAPDGS